MLEASCTPTAFKSIWEKARQVDVVDTRQVHEFVSPIWD